MTFSDAFFLGALRVKRTVKIYPLRKLHARPSSAVRKVQPSFQSAHFSSGTGTHVRSQMFYHVKMETEISDLVILLFR